MALSDRRQSLEGSWPILEILRLQQFRFIRTASPHASQGTPRSPFRNVVSRVLRWKLKIYSLLRVIALVPGLSCSNVTTPRCTRVFLVQSTALSAFGHLGFSRFWRRSFEVESQWERDRRCAEKYWDNLRWFRDEQKIAVNWPGQLRSDEAIWGRTAARLNTAEYDLAIQTWVSCSFRRIYLLKKMICHSRALNACCHATCLRLSAWGGQSTADLVLSLNTGSAAFVKLRLKALNTRYWTVQQILPWQSFGQSQWL